MTTRPLGFLGGHWLNKQFLTTLAHSQAISNSLLSPQDLSLVLGSPVCSSGFSLPQAALACSLTYLRMRPQHRAQAHFHPPELPLPIHSSSVSSKSRPRLVHLPISGLEAKSQPSALGDRKAGQTRVLEEKQASSSHLRERVTHPR